MADDVDRRQGRTKRWTSASNTCYLTRCQSLRTRTSRAFVSHIQPTHGLYMLPSTRTPEGDDNTCRVCGHAVRIESSMPPGDAPCPHCGALLWFVDGAIDSMDARRAALLWQRANAAMEANQLHVARQRLRRAIALDPSNTVFKETLAHVESHLLEADSLKRRQRERRQPS
jgi:hypothetical protein